MSIKNLKASIIGLGRMGKIRAHALKNLGVEVISVYDTQIDRAREIQAIFPDCSIADNFDDFDWSGCDCIFICSPPGYHCSQISHAIELGIPFFVEKPVALKAEEVYVLIDKLHARKSVLLHSVGYMNRYRASVQYVRNLLVTQPALSFMGCWVNKKYAVPWWQNPNESGGPLNEQATHLIDLTRYFMGEVSQVHAFGTSFGGDFWSTISINLHFVNGQVGNLLYSCDALSKLIGFEIFTQTEKIVLDGWDFNLNNLAGNLPPSIEENIFEKETASFIKSVAEENRSYILSDLTDSVKTQKVVDSIHASLNERKIINLL